VVARNLDHAAEIAYAPGSQLRKVVTMKVNGFTSTHATYTCTVCGVGRVGCPFPACGPLLHIVSARSSVHRSCHVSTIVCNVQGELISESGTMTGGGGRPRRGKMRVGSGAPAGAASDDGKDVIVLERDLQQLLKVPARCLWAAILSD
jgi:hypothetical protein